MTNEGEKSRRLTERHIIEAFHRATAPRRTEVKTFKVG